MSETKIEITGDARHAEREYERLEAKQSKQDAGHRGNAATAKQTARQIEAANEAAAQKGAGSYNRILRELRRQGPEGRAQAKAIEAHLQETGQAGRRSMEAISAELQSFDPAAAAAAATIKQEMAEAANSTAARLKRAADELEKMGPKGKAQAAAIRQHLRETGQDGARSVDKIINEIDKIDDHTAAVARKAAADFDKAGKKGQQAFGSGPLNDLKKFALGWIGVSTAVNVVTTSIDKMRASQRAAVDSLDAQSDGTARLLQVSTDASDFEAMQGTADRLAATYGIGRDEARQLGFSARSEGFEGSQEFIAQNAQILGIQSQATVAGQVPGLFSEEKISSEEAINATLVAAEKSRLNFEEIARALPAVAASAAPTKATFDESAASLSVLAAKFKSGDTAGDRLAALAAKLNLDTGEAPETDEDFAKRLEKDPNAVRDTKGRTSLADIGLIEAVRQLRDEYSDEQRADFLGESKELNEAYNAMAEQLDVVKEREGQIRAAREASGTDKSATAIRRRIADSNPQLVALREKKAADNAAEIEAEKALAEREAKQQAKIAREKAEGYARGDSALQVETTASINQARATYDETSRGAFQTLGNTDFGNLSSDTTALLRDESLSPEDRRKAEALNFAAVQLDTQRQSGSTVGLSPGDVRTYLSTQSGEYVDPAQVTPDVVRTVNNEVGAIAGQAPSDTNARNRLDFIYSASNRERQTGLLQQVTPAEQILSTLLTEQNQLLKRQNELLESNNQSIGAQTAAAQATADATKQTAENTRVAPTDPSKAQRAELAISDSRAGVLQ